MNALPDGVVTPLVPFLDDAGTRPRAVRRSAVMLLARTRRVRRGDTVLILAEVSNGRHS